jgi:hypothetical protein
MVNDLYLKVKCPKDGWKNPYFIKELKFPKKNPK